MTNLLNNIFEQVDEEKKLLLDIKLKINNIEKDDAKLLFNYYLYTSIFLLAKQKSNARTEVRHTLRAFIAKEENITVAVASLNNTYEIGCMQTPESLINVLSGKPSTMLNLTSDAAKIGALLALYYKLYQISKLDILKETLFLS